MSVVEETVSGGLARAQHGRLARKLLREGGSPEPPFSAAVYRLRYYLLPRGFP
jgi:hypothetical protein